MIVIETELEKMPENCKNCQYIRETENGYAIAKICSLTSEYLEDDMAVNYKRTEKERGFYCPLKEIQEQ